MVGRHSLSILFKKFEFFVFGAIITVSQLQLSLSRSNTRPLQAVKEFEYEH